MLVFSKAYISFKLYTSSGQPITGDEYCHLLKLVPISGNCNKLLFTFDPNTSQYNAMVSAYNDYGEKLLMFKLQIRQADSTIYHDLPMPVLKTKVMQKLNLQNTLLPYDYYKGEITR